MNPAALSAALKGDLSNMIAASMPGGIERQEAQGQRSLVASETLPKEIRGATREQLTELGFAFGTDVDELFVNVKLPAGWTKRATDHSMHSDVLDEQGRVRAGIFYKAAFYDRRADMQMNRRFLVEPFKDGADDKHRRCVVTDCGAVIHEAGEWEQGDYALSTVLENEAVAWLAERHPDWQNPLAYW